MLILTATPRGTIYLRYTARASPRCIRRHRMASRHPHDWNERPGRSRIMEGQV